jgi:uncharacterized membrane protein
MKIKSHPIKESSTFYFNVFHGNLFLLYAIVFIFLFLPIHLFAKSYSIDRIDIQAKIMSNGDLHISEARTYTFNGQFSWATYLLPLKGIGDIRYFSLSDQFSEYQLSSVGKSGTYYVQKDPQQFFCKWFYHCENETRTFTLRYTATDVAIAHQDVAEFYYKFVGELNDKSIAKVSVIIELPQKVDTSSVKAFAHGPLWGSIRFNRGILRMEVQPLPAYQYWEARVLFPKEWIPDAIRQTSAVKFTDILQEEKVWAQQANEARKLAQEKYRQRKERQSRAWQYAIILSIAGLLGFTFLYNKYGKGYSVPYYQKVDSELPEDYPPAMVSALYFNKNIYGTTLSATLFDLARRGFISIEQDKPPQKKWWGTSKPQFSIKLESQTKENDRLQDYESDLINFMFNELGEGRSSVELKAFQKNQSKVQKWFRSWKKLLSAHYQDVAYYDKSSIKGTIIGAIMSVLITLGGVIILITLGSPGILAIVAGSILLGLSFVILRYTPEIKLKRKKWEALKNYLKKYHFAGEQSQDWLKNVQKYLVYGIALGVGNKVIRKLIDAIPADQHTTIFPWYCYGSGITPSPADFASAVTSMVTIASSTMSSSTGTGGGASGGGGGGGGGASGGAG